jgi:Mn-containing catalase
MYMRIDKLQIELPKPTKPDPMAAGAVQELLGGRFGEMSTVMNYTYQSFNMRGRDKIKPFYDLVANIATEELGHIELVSATINSMLNGATESVPPTDAPLSSILGARNLHQFLTNGNSTVVSNSMNMPWQGDYVFSSGDLILDLLHNFFLENGARLQKIRVYEMTQNSVARQMIGYLLVRGGVHAAAYAKALEDLTGVAMTKMLPIPKIENSTFPEARQFEERGVHRKLYRFSQNDYKDMGAIWRGPFPTGGEYEVVDGPPEGGPLADLPPEPENYAPGYHPDELAEIAQRLMRAM